MKLVCLSEEFYKKYQNCNEILQKLTRPYVCLEIKINGKEFAIPFRHHIVHKYAFITHDMCGLDYTKAVVIESGDYIANIQPRIEQKDFNAIKGKDARIIREFKNYLKLYRKALKYCNSPYYKYIIQCSALQYFDL